MGVKTRVIKIPLIGWWWEFLWEGEEEFVGLISHLLNPERGVGIE
jgi:hypothetical protein